MPATTGEMRSLPPAFWAATDPIPPVQDFNIPIPQHKPPPLAEDFYKQREQRRRKKEDKAPEQPHQPAQDGHIDDYA